VLIGVNHHDSWGGQSWNHADHRAVGRALLDAARDAGNPWIFQDENKPWDRTRFVAFSSSPHATHAVDVTDHIDAGIASLRCHETYLANLEGGMTDVDEFLRSAAAASGPTLGVALATTFEVINI
jgi:LmbE family N-acetylglucosaminyl deacetylase